MGANGVNGIRPRSGSRGQWANAIRPYRCSRVQWGRVGECHSPLPFLSPRGVSGRMPFAVTTRRAIWQFLIKYLISSKIGKGTDDWPCFVSVPLPVRSSHLEINIADRLEFVTPLEKNFQDLMTIRLFP